MNTALVIGDDCRSFLAVARSLGRAGISIHAAPFDFTSCALKSRYVKKVIRLPRYEIDSKKWVIAINDVVGRYGYSMIFPCNDRGVIPLVIHRKEIVGTQLAIPNDRAFDAFFDKSKTRKLAALKNIPVPYAEEPVSGEQLLIAADRIGYPLVIKPSSSFTGSNLTVRNKVEIVYNRSQLLLSSDNIQGKKTLVEAYFKGVGIGLSVLSKDGIILSAFQHRRIHEPKSGGGSSYRKSEPLNHELLNATKALCSETCYTGLAMFEFKLNESTRKWALLEVNARSWGSLPLAIAAGIDFPMGAYQILTSKDMTIKTVYSLGVFSRNLKADLYYYATELKGLKRWISLIKDAAGALKRFILNKERIDSFCIFDARPFFCEILDIVSEASNKACNRFSAIRRLLVFLERKRIYSIFRLAHGKFTIVFVCQGNICRSPFAEKALRNELEKTGADKRITVTSCGLLPFENRESPAFAKEAAKKYLVDLGDNSSAYIENIKFLEDAIFIVFDRKTRKDLLSIYPDVSGKILHLGAVLNDDRMEDILDPYGKEMAAFDNTYSSIFRAVDRLNSQYISRPG